MFDGEPKDVEGQCNAHLHIGDDYGDNHGTMRCHLAPNHQDAYHEETYMSDEQEVTIRWKLDERNEMYCGLNQSDTEE